MVVATLIAALVVAAVAVAVALGRGDRLEPAVVDRAAVGLPPGPVSAADVAAVRFDTGLRGYRMDQVDAVLDRLAAELAERDDRIATLESAYGGGGRHQHMTTLPEPAPDLVPPTSPGDPGPTITPTPQPADVPPLPQEPDAEPPVRTMPGAVPPGESGRIG